MKKFLVFMIVAVMVVGLIGTASAQTPTRRNLLPSVADSVFASPVTGTGVSIYVLSGATTALTDSGVSLVALNPTTGTSVTVLNFAAATTAFATPAVSGETVFVQTANSNGSGTSIFAVDGSRVGVSYWVASLSFDFANNLGTGARLFSTGNGATGYTAPLTLDPAGTSIFATTPGGVNVRVISANIRTGTRSSATTGVSEVWAAPLISGNSLYVVGNYALGAANNGVSLLALNKATLAVNRQALVTRVGTTPFVFPTPAIAGNSIFVVDSSGGLTAYSKNTLAAGANDIIQFAGAANSSVTASPVTNGNFLVVTANNFTSGQAGVTVFDLRSRPLGGGTGASWWFIWPNAGTEIISTPAISNGVLYTAVNEPTNGRIDRFNLSGHSGLVANPDFAAITTDSTGTALGNFDYSSPIIKGESLYLVSNTGGGGTAPKVYHVDLDAGGTNAWPQFKFDAERTGNNTATAAAAPVVGDDDSGCFISTIK